MKRVEISIDLAIYYVSKYRNSLYSYKDMAIFCRKNNISLDDMKMYINVVDDLNVEKYLEMYDKIRDGIELEDGRIRKFDLIDYYSYFEFNPTKLVASIRNDVEHSKIIYLKYFANRYKNDYVLNSNGVYSKYKERIMYNYKKDENGNYIAGSGMEITSDEKTDALVYILENKIPLTELTYHDCINRIKEKTFLVPEKKDIKDDKKITY